MTIKLPQLCRRGFVLVILCLAGLVLADEAAGAGLAARKGADALIKAVYDPNGSGDLERLQTLLKSGVDVNSIGGKGYTALHQAAAVGDIEAIQILLRAGADVNARDIHGATPLLSLYLFRPSPAVSVLLKAGADVNARDFDGRTVLMYRMIHHSSDQDYEFMQLLFKAGANVNLVDAYGKTALTYAKEELAKAREGNLEESVEQTTKEIQLLEEQGGREVKPPVVEPELVAAIISNNLAKVQALLATGAKVDARETGGETPLLRAAIQGHLEIVKALLVAGADVNARTDMTPLVAATFNGHAEIVRTLLKAGAEVDTQVQTYDASSALESAILINNFEIARDLLEAGAFVRSILPEAMKDWGVKNKELLELIDTVLTTGKVPAATQRE